MKKFLAIIAIASFAVACNNSGESKDAAADSAAAKATADSLAAVATADSLAKAAADTANKPATDTAAAAPAK